MRTESQTGKAIAAIFTVVMVATNVAWATGPGHSSGHNVDASLQKGAPKVRSVYMSPKLAGTDLNALKSRFSQKGMNLLSWQVTSPNNRGDEHRLVYLRGNLLFTEIHKKPQRTNQFGKSGQRVVFSRLKISEDLQRALYDAIVGGYASVSDCCAYVTGAGAKAVADLIGVDIAHDYAADQPTYESVSSNVNVPPEAGELADVVFGSDPATYAIAETQARTPEKGLEAK